MAKMIILLIKWNFYKKPIQVFMEWTNLTAVFVYIFLVTRVWSETHFEGYCDPRIMACCDQFQYDLYLLTGIDLPWEKDDLRDRPHDREYMFDYFKNILDQRQENYSIIEGNEEERLEKAVAAIDRLLKKT